MMRGPGAIGCSDEREGPDRCRAHLRGFLHRASDRQTERVGGREGGRGKGGGGGDGGENRLVGFPGLKAPILRVVEGGWNSLEIFLVFHGISSIFFCVYLSKKNVPITVLVIYQTALCLYFVNT